jgi:3-methyladenine DNA glycosylase AlkC
MTTTTHRYQSDFARRYFSQGEAEAVLTILDARGIAVPDEIRANIAKCTDLDQLGRWIRRAATADKIQDLDDQITG